VLVPVGHDGPATLTALAIGTSTGMSVGGAALLVALRRAAGPGVGAGLGRTSGVLAVAGTAGALAGRWTADTTLELVGGGVLGAVGAAAVGAVLAVAVVLAATWFADRSTLGGLMGSRRASAAEPVVEAASS
jgi:putative peptidoglycan lipid II flippase